MICKTQIAYTHKDKHSSFFSTEYSERDVVIEECGYTPLCSAMIRTLDENDTFVRAPFTPQCSPCSPRARVRRTGPGTSVGSRGETRDQSKAENLGIIPLRPLPSTTQRFRKTTSIVREDDKTKTKGPRQWSFCYAWKMPERCEAFVNMYMKTPTELKAEAGLDKVSGTLEEAWGEFTGSPRIRAKGKMKKAKGSVKFGAAELAETAKDFTN